MRDPADHSEIEHSVDEDLAARAIEVIEQEASAILAVSRRLSAAEVEQAIHMLLACRGKVVVFGSGKSGVAARKIAGTLTSTGTAAVYLHPVDALHGDLGVVASGDVAMVVSNSGETDEVMAVLPALKRRAIPIVALVGDTRSSLALQADVVLDASVDKEAGALNLAPTTSTTVAMVIGDALATTLMSVRGFTAEDFALLHPAGILGKRLTLRVGDLMHAGTENPTVGESATWMDILDVVTRGGLGAVNVVDDAGGLKGIITDGDLRRSMQRLGLEAFESASASDVMTTDPVVVSSDDLAFDALRIMEDRPSQISVLPVVDEERRCVGLLRLHDIVRAGLR